MSISRCLFRIWMALTVVAVLAAGACFWLVLHLPAAQSVSQGNMYIPLFLVSIAAPIVIGPVLIVLGLVWGLLRWTATAAHHAAELAVFRFQPAPRSLTSGRRGLAVRDTMRRIEKSPTAQLSRWWQVPGA